MGLRMVGGSRANPFRSLYARLLCALLLVGALGTCALADEPPERERVEATAKEVAKGELALARLRELGAKVLFDKPSETGQRTLSIGFSSRSTPLAGRGNENSNSDYPAAWEGDDSDFRLLEKVAALGELSLSIDCKLVSPRAISRLRLAHPLRELLFYAASNQAFDELESLLPCRKLVIPADGLTPESYRRLAVLARGVESLSLQGQGSRPEQIGASDADLAELAGLENLAELSILNSAITDVGIKHLTSLKRLEHLTLLNCPALNDSDLAGLNDLGALRSLDLQLQISPAGMKNIGRLGSLEKLNIRYGIGKLDPENVAPLGQLTQLKELSIGPKEINPMKVALGDAIGLAAGRLPNLQVLNLQIVMSNEGLEAIAAIPNLQSLRLQLDEVNDQSLALVCRSAELRTLHLLQTGKLSDEGLAPLAKLTQLVDLNLPGHGVTDAGLASLAGLTAMKSLNLYRTSITGSGLAALDRWQSLQSLRLSGSPFNDEGCRLLPQFSRLESLYLDETKITDAGMASICAIPNLSVLSIIADKAVTDVGLASLEPATHLQNLTAFNTSTSKEGFYKLQASLHDLHIYATIDVPGPNGAMQKVRIRERYDSPQPAPEAGILFAR